MGKLIDFPNTPTAEDLSLQERRRAAIQKLPRYRGEVPSKNTIRGLPDVQPGQIFWVEMDGKAYIVAEKEGRKLTIKALDETATVSTGMTIFEMNKSIISKEPIFNWEDAEAVNALVQRLKEFFDQECNDKFFLLYGRDIHYVSLIHNESGVFDTEAYKTLVSTIQNIGDLISMDFNSSDGEISIEIWIRTATSKAELLYLFPYDKGLVTI